jgi:putative salt-induced outer membrane protein YdiY
VDAMGSILRTVFVSWILVFSSFVFAKSSIQVEEEKEVVLDTIHVHGMVLKGKIMDIGPNKLSFRLVNIDGINRIPYKDIDKIHTKYNYNIYYGNQNISGKLTGIVNNDSLEIESAGKTKLVKIANIDHFAMTVEDDPSVENYVRNKLPHISGSFNVGLELESGSSDTSEITFDAKLLRKKGQHETVLRFIYDYETKETSTTPKTTTDDDLHISLVNRYYYDPDNFLYAALMGEYDRPRSIDSRFVPSAGYGHHFRLGKNSYIRPWVGLAYVWTSYTDEASNPDISFTAAAMGLDTQYQFDDVMLINKLKVDGQLIYFPSISDPNEDWITRANLGFTAPIYGFLTMKLGIQWINDSNPDPSIGNNKTKTNLMFGFEF